MIMPGKPNSTTMAARILPLFSTVAILTLMILQSALAAPAAKQMKDVDASFREISIESLYVKKETWQDTLQTSIERMVRENPTFELGRCQLKDKWFRRGPFKPNPGRKPPDCDFGGPLTKIDLGAKDGAGNKLWEYTGPVSKNQPYDLKLPKHSSVFQCRQYNSDQAGSMQLYLSSSVALTMWQNGKRILELGSAQVDLYKPRLINLEVLKGRNETLIRFDNDANAASTHFFIKFNNITGLRQRLVEELQKKVAEDFTSSRDTFQQGVDSRNRIWFAPWVCDDEVTASRDLARRYAKAVADGEYRKVFEAAAKTAKTHDDVKAIRAACYNYHYSRALETQANFQALHRAIEDKSKDRQLAQSFDAKTFGERLARLEKAFAMATEDTLRLKKLPDLEAGDIMSTKPMSDTAFNTINALVGELATLRRDVLLANPAIGFDRLLMIKRHSGNLGLPSNWVGSGAISGNLDDELVVMRVRDPEAKLETSFKPAGRETIADVDLNWDGRRVLYSSTDRKTRAWQVFEIIIDPVTGKIVKEPRLITPRMGDGVNNYDPCYLPDDRILFCSTAVHQGVPCLAGSGQIANLYLLSRDGQKVRQLCFDQDHNWCPTVLGSGRVLFLRWEYVDTPHYFTRLLFQMNPDGTGQTAYYGSNSYWPNSIFCARPVPGHPTKVVGIVSGHHGVARAGELVLFDTALGRRETEGVVQRIPGYGKKVERLVADHLVGSSWPKFVHPYPVDEKNFIVACKPSPGENWGLYIVDVFDNMVLLKESDDYVYFEPLPLRSTKKPPIIPDSVDLARKDAVVYIVDLYSGPGLKGVPRGSIDRIRILEPHYNYSGKHTGGYINAAIEGGWEPKRIIGTVPVEKDGSAMFRVPANTPILFQPVDKQGRAYQLMRSWTTAMPGEALSCVGCHEDQNSTAPTRGTLASLKAPADIEPWYGFTRGYDFVRELQPVLQAKCVKCHDGTKKDRPNFADTKHGQHEFYNSYHALHPYVRRPGPEGDYHILRPLEYHVSTSELVQMLEKGHHKVKLNAEEWDRLVTWIDMNVPAFGTWSDRTGKEFIAKQHKARLELRKLYASVSEDPEEPLGDPTSPINVKFASASSLKGRKIPVPLPASLKVAKVDNEKPLALQPFEAKPSDDRITVDLGKDIKFELVSIPAGSFVMGTDDGFVDEGPRRLVQIKEPFYMATVEIANELYKLFDPEHDTRFIDLPGMSQTREGLPVNSPRQPVSRVTWKDAMAFCKWLSEKTGDTYTLPTEEQWEWACRAGTTSPFFYGDVNTDFSPYANFADKSIIGLSFRKYRPVMEDFIPRDRRYDDKSCVTADVGSYKPNPFGLHDMHGNVSEWTLSDYGKCASGHDRKVVRGGSWRDRPIKARASWRWGYYEFQPVFDVGFRVVRLANAPAKPREYAIPPVTESAWPPFVLRH
jgi:formylglycine-generating enzyme required for sulfatase activity